MPPTGFKRSRALWDNARRPANNSREKLLRQARAVLYELQPVRFEELDTQTWLHQARAAVESLTAFLVTTLPFWARTVLKFVRNLTLKHWMIVGAVLLYYAAVRWIHHVLEAGPVVIIVTALVAIFTVGLGDNRDPDGLSAYSAFNRGFQRIMGSVDAEALLAQHVGGGFVMPQALMQDMPLDGGGRNRRRHEQQRRQPEPDNQEQEPARNDAAEPDDDDDDDDDNGDDDDNNNNAPHAPAPQPRARQAGKKARRGNLEQRREMRRQRDAAMAMGFGGDQQDAQAMHRLLQDQVVEAEQRLQQQQQDEREEE
jgi:hypothetical protein